MVGALAAAACAGRVVPAPEPAPLPGPKKVETPLCAASSSSSLPGVTLAFRAQQCEFTPRQLQAGIALPYRLRVERPPGAVTSEPLDSGGCQRPGAAGLLLFEEVRGAGQRYCLCDVGLCAPGKRPRVELPEGEWDGELHWDGLSWLGPSDFKNPKGSAFPPGRYEAIVRSRGTLHGPDGDQPFEVEAILPIRVLGDPQPEPPPPPSPPPPAHPPAKPEPRVLPIPSREAGTDKDVQRVHHCEADGDCALYFRGHACVPTDPVGIRRGEETLARSLYPMSRPVACGMGGPQYHALQDEVEYRYQPACRQRQCVVLDRGPPEGLFRRIR